MNIQELKVGDLVTWRGSSFLIPGPDPIFLITQIEYESPENFTVHLLVPNEGTFTTSSIFLRAL
jgi:hypothetical protein